MASVEGPKRVVVLTDGEETCDGDPEAAIAALKEAQAGRDYFVEPVRDVEPFRGVIDGGKSWSFPLHALARCIGKKSGIHS